MVVAFNNLAIEASKVLRIPLHPVTCTSKHLRGFCGRIKRFCHALRPEGGVLWQCKMYEALRDFLTRTSVIQCRPDPSTPDLPI